MSGDVDQEDGTVSGDGGRISPRRKAARRDTRTGWDGISLDVFFLLVFMMLFGYRCVL